MTDIVISDSQILLTNDRISYLIHILPGGILMHAYFGAKIDSLNTISVLRRCGLPEDGSFSLQECTLDRTPQEYPSFGLGDMREGAFSIRSDNGTSTADFRLVKAQLCSKPELSGLPYSSGQDSSSVLLLLRDETLLTELSLIYTIFDDCDVIARSALFRNCGDHSVELEKAYSLCLDLPDSQYDLLTLSGAWAREREMIRRPLVPGEQSVSSLRGASSLQASPFAALLRKETSELSGEVIASSLIYSGNFYAGVHVDANHQSRLLLGINDSGFGWKLDPGDSFQTPEAVLTYSSNGLNGMSRNFHRFCAKHIVRGHYAQKERPILINNWEATYFDFTEEKILALAQKASELGIELFVLDDGWFGHREDDHSSLGDWFPNSKKLPNGLEGLSDRIHQMGLSFGLWVEPEMVSPDSDLYRAHPGWCIHVDKRERIEGRHQLILDLTRQDVCDFIYQSISNLLRPGKIDYIKWDMNRNFSNIGSDCLPSDRQRELPHRYMLGLYKILDKITSEFPNVLFESCASGGGRFDMGMLYYMPQTWCSDNTDALSRCRIQYSTSLLFPPFAMGSHISAVPNHQTGRTTPLSSRASVASSGCFGFELDLLKLNEEEQKECQRWIQWVKLHRQTLLFGQFYRLLSPYQGNETAWITVSEDKNEAVFVFLQSQAIANEPMPLVRLCGLQSERIYRVEETGEMYSGSELMNYGISFPLRQQDAASVHYTLKAVGKE